LPVDGTLSFALRPGIATVTNGNFHLFSTSVVADGSIGMENLNLKVQMASSDLRNLSFLYADANGTGSFEGVLSGAIKTPQVQGTFDLRKYKYQDWTIEQAAGMARLDTGTNAATLTDVRVVQGKSQITVNGTSALDGTKVNLRIQAAEVEQRTSHLS
jgi:autotransporter translocation and assembly factor TamB